MVSAAFWRSCGDAGEETAERRGKRGKGGLPEMLNVQHRMLNIEGKREIPFAALCSHLPLGEPRMNADEGVRIRPETCV